MINNLIIKFRLSLFPRVFLLYFGLSLFLASSVFADDLNRTTPYSIGLISSLSGFAANYGSAVLEGARLAEKELNQDKEQVKLIIEDDQSLTKNTVSAYAKLYNVDKIQGLIGGSWWVNAIVKQSENNKIPLLSCETLYNKDIVKGANYFLLQGDLRDWVRIYEPLIEEKKLKRGAIIRFVSGFGETLSEEMQRIFSKEGRTFVGSIEYSEIAAADAVSAVIQLKKLNPDVVYIDAQPGGLASIIKKIKSLGIKNLTILAHSAAADALKQGLINPELLSNLYFTQRETFKPSFEKKFLLKYGKKPYLNSDLGYYAVHLMYQALQSQNSINYLKSNNLIVDDINFSFDSNNVYRDLQQEVWGVNFDGSLIRIDMTKL